MILGDSLLQPERLETTLAVAAPRDSVTLTLSVAGKIGPGDFVYLEGPNTSSNSSSDSDGTLVVLKEPVRVASVSGVVVTLSSPLSQYHAAGVTVRALTPVVDAVVKDLTIDAAGGNVAVGVLLRRAVNVTVEGVSGVGFSRALVDLEGVKGFEVTDVYSRGEVNSIVYADSVMSGRIDGVRSDPFGLRHHAQGIPRGLLSFRNRCSDIVVPSAVLERGVVGLRVWGGYNIAFGDLVVRDMNSDRADQTWPTVGEHSRGAHIGAGISGGAGFLAYSEFAHGITFGSVLLENTRHPAQGFAGCSAYLHDWVGVHMDSLQIVNSGDGSQPMFGAIMSDLAGDISLFVASGVDYGLRTENAWASIQIDLYAYYGNDGADGAHSIAAAFGHAAAGPRIRRFVFGNTSGGVRFVGGFGDTALTIESFAPEYVGGEYERAIVARNDTADRFQVGDVVELDPASPPGTLLVRAPDGPNPRNAVGWLMVCPLPAATSRVMASADAIHVGDLLMATVSATLPRRAERADELADPLTILGRALSSKPAGIEGLVTVGPR